MLPLSSFVIYILFTLLFCFLCVSVWSLAGWPPFSLYLPAPPIHPLPSYWPFRLCSTFSISSKCHHCHCGFCSFWSGGEIHKALLFPLSFLPFPPFSSVPFLLFPLPRWCGIHCVTKDGLELERVLLPQSPEYWDSRLELRCLAFFLNLFIIFGLNLHMLPPTFRASHLQDWSSSIDVL